ncbi:hypothetical protein [Nitrosopumilus ureiphilus]|uniref:hypothetical protein n=1 Tax=Nitrosopumilus ureiphilus TaxID=1470067 RepID=UPI0015CA46A0|nr:hypothetical protein [Nitrosopumilus ureiphilus]
MLVWFFLILPLLKKIHTYNYLVYQIPNPGFDKSAYVWGESGKLFMMSPLDNKDPQKIEVITANNYTFQSEIQIYPDSAIQKNFILTETGPDTGLFE